jgi:hypothetical protein
MEIENINPNITTSSPKRPREEEEGEIVGAPEAKRARLSEAEKLKASMLEFGTRRCKFPIGIDKEDVRAWFGHHGVYITDMTGHKSPFQALYFAHPTRAFRFPVIGLTLKPHRDGEVERDELYSGKTIRAAMEQQKKQRAINDAEEIIPPDAVHPGELVLFKLVNPKSAPEPYITVSTKAFLAAFGEENCEKWV